MGSPCQQKIGLFADVLAEIHGSPDLSRFMVPYASSSDLGVDMRVSTGDGSDLSRSQVEEIAVMANDNSAKYSCVRSIEGLLQQRGLFDEQQR